MAKPKKTKDLPAEDRAQRSPFKKTRGGEVLTKNEVLEIKYDFVEKFVNGFARVKIGAFYGLIDQSAKVVIQPIYHDLGSMGEMGMYARSGSKYGVIKIVDGNKEIVHPFIYKYMRANNDGSVTLFNDCIDAVDSLNLT